MLHGEYAFTLLRTCATTGAISPSPDFVFSATPTVLETVLRGILRYRADGTGSLTGEALNISATASGISPVQLVTIESTLTYSVSPDGTFTQEFAPVDFTVTAGRGIGVTGSNTGVSEQGQVGLGGRVLLLSDTAPNIENSVTTAGSSDRVCIRSGTALKVR